MRMSVIGAIMLCVAGLCVGIGGVQAQTMTLTPLASYDAGENIVSYYRYVATLGPLFPNRSLSCNTKTFPAPT